jgi:ribosomal-protein-alanine N-acetyltransferase
VKASLRAPPRRRVELEPPSAARAEEFVAAALRSRALHRGFVTVPASAAEFADYLVRCGEQRLVSRFIVTTGARALAGVVEILDREVAPASSGRLAYYAFVPHAGQGLTTEGVTLAVALAFRELELAELTADVQKNNRRSIAVVEKLGFRRDEQAPARKVGRRWVEHERWRLARAEWRGFA